MAVGVVLWPGTLGAADKPVEPGASTVSARYKLRYNGINVGHLEMRADKAAKTYALAGAAQVSVLFGTVRWSGSTNVAGAMEGGAPAPRTYALDWRNNKKVGAIRMGFKNRMASEVAVTPPPKDHPDLVPLKDTHKAGALDPVSAIMALTKVDSRPPCDRRTGVFDGKQRYDIVFTPKREIKLPAAGKSDPPETGYVCRVTYEPIAGHRNNEDTKTYVANREVEIVLRRVPGVDMVIPHSVTIPTTWGTGTMLPERIEVTGPTGVKIALGQ